MKFMKTKITFFFILLIIFSSNVSAENILPVTFKNTTLEGENVFSGTIFIEGRVTISENATLTIKAGTKIIFVFIDTDNDGIGESEILSQGKVIVDGTEDNPVIFTSDKKIKGAWLGLSIMSVDNESFIKNAFFEHAYMALHSHFSNLYIENCVFKDNYRGFQSQEGTMKLMKSKFYHNNTALQFRNSKATLENLNIYDNFGGLNFLYSEAILNDVKIDKNTLFGMKIRYSKAYIKNAYVKESVQNIYTKKSELIFERTSSIASLQRGFSFEDSKINMKYIESIGNFTDGISLDGTQIECSHIDLSKNGRFDLYLKGTSHINDDCFENIRRLKVYKE